MSEKISSGYIKSASSSLITSPFSVIIRKNPADPTGNTYQARVEYNSSISQPSEKLNDRLTISRLTTYNSDGTVADASWFPYDRGDDLIWVDVTTNPYGTYGPVGSSATIKSYGMGGGWVPSDPPQEYGTGSGKYEYQVQYDDAGNPYYVNYVTRLQIMESSTSGTKQADGTYYVDSQLLNTHLQLVYDSYYGPGATADGTIEMAVLKLVPYAGPYV